MPQNRRARPDYVIMRLNSGEQRLVLGKVHGDGRAGVEPRFT